MRKLTLLISLTALIGLNSCTGAGTTDGQTNEVSAAVTDFISALEEELPGEIHSFMLRQHGEVVASGWWDPYRESYPHMLYSLSKSFTSTAIGMAQDEGLLSIDDQVISFFPEKLPDEISDNLKNMRIRDLLKMNSGHDQDAVGRMKQKDSWVEGFLGLEVEHKPGTHFRYNSGATYMLSAIVQKVSGMTLDEYLTPRLFEPLGIESHFWELSPEGVNAGGWGLNITTESISLFGQLLLQKGEWEGRQLVSRAWVEEATSFQTSNGSNPESDWDQGYGYKFWMCRHAAFRGDGAFGQYCIVFPGHDAVLAMTSGCSNLQAVLNQVWKHLLPALEKGSLPVEAHPRALVIPPLGGEDRSEEAEALSGSYALEANPLSLKSVSLDFTGEPVLIKLSAEDSDQTIQVGSGEWIAGSLGHPTMHSDRISASGTWISPEKYELKIIYTETPYIFKQTYSFNEEELALETELNVSFGNRKPGVVRGKKLP